MNTSLHSPVCDLLGCTYPLVLAGMGGVARAELVGAVTQAGGFGFLGMVRESVALIRSQVQHLRERGIHRFGVNLIPTATDPALLEAQVAACIEFGVPVVGLFWDLSVALVQRLRGAGIVVRRYSRPARLPQPGSELGRAQAAGATADDSRPRSACRPRRHGGGTSTQYRTGRGAAARRGRFFGHGSTPLSDCWASRSSGAVGDQGVTVIPAR